MARAMHERSDQFWMFSSISFAKLLVDVIDRTQKVFVRRYRCLSQQRAITSLD
jgi:hypothetical protein